MLLFSVLAASILLVIYALQITSAVSLLVAAVAGILIFEFHGSQQGVLVTIGAT